MRVKQVTSWDVAELAGVSQSTVSRALRLGSTVNEETRQRVEKAARTLRYQADINARKLRSQSTNTLAVLLREDPSLCQSLINPFFLSMLGNIIKAASRRGYDLLISFQQSSEDWSADYGSAHRADGIIFLGYGDYLHYADKLSPLQQAETPFITWGPVVPHEPGHFLGSDNVRGAEEAVGHLIGLGRRRIVFVGSATDGSPEFRDRYRGYANAIEAAGLEPIALPNPDAESFERSGQHAVETLVERGERFDGIFAACDLIAIGAMKALHAHGIRVPEDVAVVGFDDIVVAAYTTPPLTTARQDTAAAGELLVENLVRLIEGAEPNTTPIPTTLVVRESCGSGRAG